MGTLSIGFAAEAAEPVCYYQVQAESVILKRQIDEYSPSDLQIVISEFADSRNNYSDGVDLKIPKKNIGKSVQINESVAKQNAFHINTSDPVVFHVAVNEQDNISANFWEDGSKSGVYPVCWRV